ncbi:phosphoglucosamine mutase [candidate division KSB1 bacterium]
MISISGIRGIVDKDLTPEIVKKFAFSFGKHIGGGKIVVGRDSRQSGEELKDHVFSGLQNAGCKVIYLGICPTPTIEINVKHLKAAGGIAITASHNPSEWNALKLIDSKGMFLDETEGEQVVNIFNNDKTVISDEFDINKVEFRNDAVKNHINKLLDIPFINTGLIKKKKFKVALDCVNGAGCVMFPELMSELNCEYSGINLEPNGEFLRNPEPTAENLEKFSEFIKTGNFDIGFACDPDADRLSIVNEKGIPLGEEYSLITAVDFLLSKKKGNVVINESTSMGIDVVAKKYDCDVLRTKVGEINVTKKMIETGSPIGGEGNGGVILPEVHYGRDAFTGAVLVLQLMVEKGIPFSEYQKSLPKFFMLKEKLNMQIDSYGDLYHAVKDKIKDVEYSFTDGVRITGKNWWVHIRKSNTEPVVRIITESDSKNTIKEISEKFINILKDKF